MPEEDDIDYQRSINNITEVVERIETKLVGDLDNQGLIGKVHDVTKSCQTNTQKINVLEVEDKKKHAKELALAVSIILLLVGIVFNLIK